MASAVQYRPLFGPVADEAGECPLLALSRHSQLHRTCPLSGAKRTSPFAAHMSAYDAVDGARSEASSAIGGLREATHIEGSRPWARLARSVLILRSPCSRCTGLM